MSEDANASAQGVPKLDPEAARKIAALRSQLRENFGKVAMAMMGLPRYRGQSLADLQHLVLEPMAADRIALAYPVGREGDPLADVAGLAIWASVSDEVDASIREQVKAGVFPVRLKAGDWTSGDNHWLLDVIAPDAKATARVIANFRQLVKEGSLRVHPLVARLVEPGTLEKLGAERISGKTAPAPSADERVADAA